VQALEREIAEELGAIATVGALLETVEWAYPDKRVRLHFFRCTVAGEPRPLEGQEIAWVRPEDLPRYEFPAADATLIARLAGASTTGVTRVEARARGARPRGPCGSAS